MNYNLKKGEKSLKLKKTVIIFPFFVIIVLNLKYMDKTDDNQEIQNLKKTIEYAYEHLQANKRIDYALVNEMHRIILDSVRGSEKTPGRIRTTQNWIGRRGVGIDGATFIPPIPEEVYGLLQNLYDYMNDEFIDPLLVNVAISHAQFETIHAYKDGNGRLGRALIPVQMAMLDDERPILYLSEMIELYKPSYQRFLMESRKGNVAGYIKFFLQKKKYRMHQGFRLMWYLILSTNWLNWGFLFRIQQS